MSVTAILGAGPVGSAIAHRLSERGRVGEVRLIDENAGLAAGKALDIRQTGPIARFDTVVGGGSDVLSAAGADVVVFADDTVGGEWEGERGLALVQRLVRAGMTAPFVFAGSRQGWLLEAAAREVRVPADRLVGTAAAAVVGTVASLVHIELGETGAQVSITGRPPQFIVAWGAATIGGALVTDRLAAHRLLAIAQSLPRFWPPGPQAIAAPTALVIEALIEGSRQLLPVMAMLDGEFGVRGVAGMVPVEFARGRVLRRVPPTLTPQERTETTSALSRGR